MTTTGATNRRSPAMSRRLWSWKVSIAARYLKYHSQEVVALALVKFCVLAQILQSLLQPRNRCRGLPLLLLSSLTESGTRTCISPPLLICYSRGSLNIHW